MITENEILIPEVLPPERKMPSELDNYRLNFYGNKKRLLNHILDVIPEGTKTVADLFLGTGIVSWTLKHQGYKVISNDVMRYPCIRAKALVRNQSTVLSKADIEMLCSGQKKSGRMADLLEFYKRVFGERNCRFIEAWIANIPKLKCQTKRDIAIYVVVVSISEHFSYAAVHWNRIGMPTGGKNLLGVDLEKQVRDYALNEFPKYLYDNGEDNKVYNEDAVDLVSRINADVIYFDPPYAARGGAYEGNYSIFDDLVSLLSGNGHKVVDPTDSKADLEPYTYFGSRTSAVNGMARFFQNSRHIPTIIFSYNDTSKVHPKEIVEIARSYGRNVIPLSPINVQLASLGPNKPRRTNEYLIQCHSKAA